MNNPTLIFGLACRYIQEKFPAHKSEAEPHNQRNIQILIYPNADAEGHFVASGKNITKWYWQESNSSPPQNLKPDQLRNLILAKKSPNAFIQLKSKTHIFGTWNSWHDFFEDMNNPPAEKIRPNKPEEITMYSNFTINEIKLMIAMLNSTIIDNAFKDKDALKWEVIDYCNLVEFEAAQFGDPKKLSKSISEKLEKLDGESCYQLAKKLKSFWELPEEKRNLHKFAEKIISK